MKKFLVLILCITMANVLFAQVQKGNWQVGGMASFLSDKYEDVTETTFRFLPNVGYFFIDNLAGGLRVELHSYKYYDSDKETQYNIAPFVRYYFLSATQKINVFADASYKFGHYKETYGESDYSENFQGYAIAVGPAFFLTPNVALEFTLGYYREKWADADSPDKCIQSNLGFQIHFGGKSVKK